MSWGGYDNCPKGSKGLGKLGECVDASEVFAYGSRAQRRRLAKIIKRDKAKQLSRKRNL